MADDRVKQLLKPSWEQADMLSMNDCFMYQLELERLLKRLLPDARMHGRYVGMLNFLATQARRCAPDAPQSE